MYKVWSFLLFVLFLLFQLFITPNCVFIAEILYFKYTFWDKWNIAYFSMYMANILQCFLTANYYTDFYRNLFTSEDMLIQD